MSQSITVQKIQEYLQEQIEALIAMETVWHQTYGRTDARLIAARNALECTLGFIAGPTTNEGETPMSDTHPTNDQLAFMELKGKIVKLMDEFIGKHMNNNLSPSIEHILVDVLTSCLSEAQYQVADYQPLTPKQEDFICYQIDDWYLMMKPLLEGQHNLGYMKEKLKGMICGE